MFNFNAIQFSKVLNDMLRTSGFSKIFCLIFCCSSPPIQRIIVNSILAIIKTPSQFVVTSIPLFRFSKIRLEIHELWRDYQQYFFGFFQIIQICSMFAFLYFPVIFRYFKRDFQYPLVFCAKKHIFHTFNLQFIWAILFYVKCPYNPQVKIRESGNIGSLIKGERSDTFID